MHNFLKVRYNYARISVMTEWGNGITIELTSKLATLKLHISNGMQNQPCVQVDCKFHVFKSIDSNFITYLKEKKFRKLQQNQKNPTPYRWL